MDKPMPLDQAVEAWQATGAAHAQAVSDLVRSIEHALETPHVERALDFTRILTSLAPIRERGLTETTRPGLITALEIARTATGR